MTQPQLPEALKKAGRIFLPHWVFLKFAAILVVLYLIAHLAGLRGHTTILSGTLPSAESDQVVGVALGLVYVLLYFAFVVLVPVFLIAAGLSFGAERLISGGNRQSACGENDRS